MTSIVTCPDCKRKLKVPEAMAGKTIRCPACKSPIPADAELDAPAPSRLVKTTPSPRSAAMPSRGRPSSDEEPEVDLELVEDEPIREKRPRKKRPSRQKSSTGLIIGLVVGGVLLLLTVLGGGVGLMVYLVRNKMGSDAAWLPFTPPGSDCTVLMPGTPTPQMNNVFDIQATQYVVERKNGHEAIGIGIFDLPPRVLRPSLLQDIANGYQKGVMDRLGGGQVESNKPITLGNLSGLEFQGKLTSRRGGLIGRIYLATVGARHRAYVLALISESLELNTSDAARLFDSFKITAPARPPDLRGIEAGGGAPPLPGNNPPQMNPPQMNPPQMNPPRMNPPRMNPPPNIPRPMPGPRMPRGPRRMQ